ncbi:MAG TPA: lamin tail domain-containing protein [Pyrinomonadaceae bacterium]|nr:lamin tail domain-containing protein [Pyrinomonadaceae bacterium]
MRKFCLTLAAVAAVCVLSEAAQAAANFVYHEQSSEYVAQPVGTINPSTFTCEVSTDPVDEAGGRYVDTPDLSPSSPAPFGAYHIYSGAYTLRFKIEFQFFTNQVRVFYTTDGTNPTTATTVSGGVTDVNPTGTTQEVVASYTYTYSDLSQNCQIVDIATATIPAQPAGTTVKYVVVAWHSAGGNVIYANSGDCPSCFACTSASCANVFEYTTIAPPPPLIISEFRLRGPGGTEDEFVEIYNNSDSDVTVSSFDGSGGFGLAASDGTVRFTIPDTTTIPAREHYLGVNSDGYTLSAYPAGLLTTAEGDREYTADIGDNAGIALFYTSNPTNFSADVRMDAVGSSAELNSLYKEGTGYPALSTNQTLYNSPHNTSLYRSLCSFVQGTGCTTPGVPKDSGDNESDFLLVDTDPAGPYCTPTANFACERLGAPGPENSSSPIQRNSTVSLLPLDRSKAPS